MNADLPRTPEELLSAIFVLKRDKPIGWKNACRAYYHDLKDLLDPDDPESRATLDQFPEWVGRRMFKDGRGMVPFWDEPHPRPEISTDTEFTV